MSRRATLEIKECSRLVRFVQLNLPARFRIASAEQGRQVGCCRTSK